MISVIMPVHNGAVYLAEAINSVLSQTCLPGEVIVVNDGSTDDSAAIAGSFGPPVCCFSIAHSWAAAARNEGIARSKGEWLAFLDADDLWTADKLEKQLAMFDAEPQLEAVLGMMESFISPELEPSFQEQVVMPERIQKGFSSGTLLIRRESFLRIGSFNPELRSGEFIDWWARATEQNLRYALLPGVVLRRRLHNNNHTLQRSNTLQDYTRLALAALQRRRKSDG